MSEHRNLRFSSLSARVQYITLMGLFRLAVTRGLYGRFARGLGRLFPAQNAVYMTTGPHAPFKIYLNDGYWTRFGLGRTPYEPEVARVIAAASAHTPLFCDLGANKGYWTVQTATQFARVIAVEASAETFRALQENAGALPHVTLRQAAIHRQSGETMTFVNIHNSHASARLLGASPSTAHDTTESVTTLAIDDLVPPGQPALIKLDVEGAETEAFAGAVRALRDGSVFLYEDHGADRECVPSAWLLAQGNISLYSTLNGVEKLTSTDQIRALKSDPFKGYNFLAGHQDSALLHTITEALQNTPDPGTSVT